MPPLLRKILFRSLLVVIAAALVVGSILHSRNPYRRDAFDAARWRQAATDWAPDNPRGGMLHSLRGQYLERGIVREQALQMLGPADHVGHNELLYRLGRYKAPPGHHDYVVLHIDHKDRVGRVEIRYLPH
jgi:hypothetical protein